MYNVRFHFFMPLHRGRFVDNALQHKLIGLGGCIAAFETDCGADVCHVEKEKGLPEAAVVAVVVVVVVVIVVVAVVAVVVVVVVEVVAVSLLWLC